MLPAMSSRLEALIAPLRHSPQLPEIVEQLQNEVEAERVRRQRFYQEMTPEQKVEFIDGEVILHSPARNAHLDVTKFILLLVDVFVRRHGLGEVKSEKCLCTFPRNDYEPDIVFFGPAKAAALQPGTMQFPVPDLVVEVLSDSTESRDRGVKFEDYAVHGVGEYWIVDVETRVVEQYLPRDGSWHLELKSSSGEIRSRIIEGSVAPVAAFFDAAANLAALQSLMD
jgi:Uma2 family endonuclease